MKASFLLCLALAAAAAAGCTTMRPTEVIAVRTSAQGVDSTAAWASLDTDQDGSVSLDEIRQQRAMGLLQDFPNADADGDERVSKVEWDAWWPRMIDHHVRGEGFDDLPDYMAP